MFKIEQNTYMFPINFDFCENRKKQSHTIETGCFGKQINSTQQNLILKLEKKMHRISVVKTLVSNQGESTEDKLFIL